MNSCGTDPVLEVLEKQEQHKLPLICLLPDWPPLDGTETEQRKKYLESLRSLYLRFAERCERSIVLTTESGLVDPQHGDMPRYKRFDELGINALHDWTLRAKPQLVGLLRPGLRVVCLAAGAQLKAIRHMELNVVCPLTGMSERLRRRWLEARLGESNFALGFNLTGGVGNPLDN